MAEFCIKLASFFYILYLCFFFVFCFTLFSFFGHQRHHKCNSVFKYCTKKYSCLSNYFL